MTHDEALKTLGLRRGASEKAIKDRYKRLAFIHHPDRNAGSAEANARLVQITEAYAVLQTPVPPPPNPFVWPVKTPTRRETKAAKPNPYAQFMDALPPNARVPAALSMIAFAAVLHWAKK